MTYIKSEVTKITFYLWFMFCSMETLLAQNVTTISETSIKEPSQPIAFDRSLSQVAVTQNGSSIGVFHTDNGQRLCEFSRLNSEHDVTFLPSWISFGTIKFGADEKQLIVNDSEGRFLICDIQKGRITRVLRIPWFTITDNNVAKEVFEDHKVIRSNEGASLHGLRVNSFVITPDQNDLLVAYEDGSLVLMEIKTSRIKRIVKSGYYKSKPFNVGTRIDGEFVKYKYGMFGIWLDEDSDWSVPKTIQIGTRVEQSYVYILGFVKNDVIIADKNGVARLNLSTGEEAWRQSCQELYNHYHCEMLSDSKFFAGIGRNTIYVYRTADGQLVRRIEIKTVVEDDPIISFETDANGHHFLLQSRSGKVFLCDKSGNLSDPELPRSPAFITAISDDGRKIATLTENDDLILFKLE